MTKRLIRYIIQQIFDELCCCYNRFYPRIYVVEISKCDGSPYWALMQLVKHMIKKTHMRAKIIVERGRFCVFDPSNEEIMPFSDYSFVGTFSGRHSYLAVSKNVSSLGRVTSSSLFDQYNVACTLPRRSSMRVKAQQLFVGRRRLYGTPLSTHHYNNPLSLFGRLFVITDDSFCHASFLSVSCSKGLSQQ